MSVDKPTLSVRSKTKGIISVKTFRFVYGVPVVLVLIVGCRNGNSSGPATSGDPGLKPAQRAAAETNADQPSAVSQPETPAGVKEKESVPDPLRGTVKETMRAGAYTYILLATDSGEHWAAARALPVAVGDEVELAGLAAMPKFHSPTLKRTFDVIQFAGSAKVIGGGDGLGAKTAGAEALSAALPSGHPSIDDVAVPPAAGASAATRAADLVAESTAVSVADLHAKKAELDGKLVRIRGKVVKANRGILGSNWLHIRDGTGAPPENDITVTSKTGFAAKGNTVVIIGTVALDRDFGSGYKYDVIVENAVVRVEDE